MHLVKRHVWNELEGRFVIFERYFETLEKAKTFAESEPYHTIKIYDEDGELVHHTTKAQAQDTYA
jgi:hypothetical protein